MTRDELIREAATGAAQRVDAESVGLDPATIIMILTNVLPLLISCFKRNDEPTSAEIRDSLEAQCSTYRGKKNLLRRTAVRIQRESKKKHERRMSDEQAFALADAVITEALNADPENVTALCSTISNAEYGE